MFGLSGNVELFGQIYIYLFPYVWFLCKMNCCNLKIPGNKDDQI